MLGKDRLLEIAHRTLAFSQADQTEVLIMGGDESLTRFANNTIHQNVAETDVTVRVRVILGQKTGVASGNDLSEVALRRVVESAETVARFQEDNPETCPLPVPQPIPDVPGYAPATAACTPEQRARGVAVICEMAAQNSLQSAGAFSTAVQEMGVFNSRGVSAYHVGTSAHLVTVIMSDDSSGYAEFTSMNVDEIDPEQVGHTAVEKALHSRNPTAIEPGAYTVILEEEAVADMVRTLAYLGLGALSVQEKRSFMRLDEKITGDLISICDDGLDPAGLPMPFDFEGVPRQRVQLIEQGVARAVVYDTLTATREGCASTGHGLPAPNTMGPIPIRLVMAEGQSTKAEMLAATERGIWVTRFHYTNPVHPIKTVLTGMTRDGTFLIENGQIVRPLKNLRFTQSILEAFAQADMLGNTTKLIASGWGGFALRVPALRTRGFNFSGTTEF